MNEEQVRQFIREELSGLLGSDRYHFQRHLQLADGRNIQIGTTTGTKIGTAITQKISVYGVTPIVQRSGSAQNAVATTGSTQTTPYGYSTAAQADAIVTLVNELRAWAVAQGFIKGSV